MTIVIVDHRKALQEAYHLSEGPHKLKMWKQKRLEGDGQTLSHHVNLYIDLLYLPITQSLKKHLWGCSFTVICESLTSPRLSFAKSYHQAHGFTRGQLLPSNMYWEEWLFSDYFLTILNALALLCQEDGKEKGDIKKEKEKRKTRVFKEKEKKVKNRTNSNKILDGRNMSKNINTHRKCE